MDRTVYDRLKAWLDDHFDALVEDIRRISAIPSVVTYDDPDTPFGPDCKRALEETLRLAEGYGFTTRNYEDRYGSVTLRPGDEEIAFWGHLDVVPAGEGWRLTEPYRPVVREGYLIGRGVDDNKGPALGVMYMLRALEELHIPTRHGLRLFLGCDEERGMRDVEHYAANYPPQKLTIIADCAFPACYGEKGIIEVNILSERPLEAVLHLKAGMASNIVPDRAQMRLRGLAAQRCASEWVDACETEGETCLQGRGLSRHSAFPEGGVNAIHEVMKAALASGLLTESDARTIGFFVRVNDDTLGTAVGIAGGDEVSGNTTCCGTMASILPDGRACLHLNIRHCITARSEDLMSRMEQACRANGCTLESVHISGPNYFPKEHPVVDALTSVYNELSGSSSEPYVMGGGTYARKLQNALGFGLGGLPREETDLFVTGHGGAHQPDEGLHLDNFKQALLIFAMGVLEADRVLT